MSNGMVVDTATQKVVFWSADPNATAKFIAECNFKKKLPYIGACLIFFGGGPSTDEWCPLEDQHDMGPLLGYRCEYWCRKSGDKVVNYVPYLEGGCPPYFLKE